MIYEFFNSLFLNLSLDYINIIKFIVVDLFTFLLTLYCFYWLYKLFYCLIVEYIKGVYKK